MAYRTRNIIFEARFRSLVVYAYRTRNITFVVCLLWFMAYKTKNIAVEACLCRFMAYIAFITRNLYGPHQSSKRTVTIRTDRTDRMNR